MGFLQKRKVCFKEESLPITHHNFHRKSLARPKSKIDNDLNPLATRLIFNRDQMHLEDHEKKTYQN